MPRIPALSQRIMKIAKDFNRFDVKISFCLLAVLLSPFA
jgi:hypothetical protein